MVERAPAMSSVLRISVVEEVGPGPLRDEAVTTAELTTPCLRVCAVAEE
jgi:hypothetical protein